MGGKPEPRDGRLPCSSRRSSRPAQVWLAALEALTACGAPLRRLQDGLLTALAGRAVGPLTVCPPWSPGSSPKVEAKWSVIPWR